MKPNHKFPINFTTFPSLYDTRVLPQRREQSTWQELKERLSKSVITPSKHDVEMIIGATMADDNEPLEAFKASECKLSQQPNPSRPDGAWVGRGKASVRDCSMLIVDYDNGTHPNYLMNTLSGYEWAWHTTWSHLDDGETFKFRLFVPFAHPVSAQQITQRQARLLRVFDGCDGSTFNPGRAFYLASSPKEREGLVEHGSNSGKLMNLEELPEDKRVLERGAPTSPTPATKQDIIDLTQMLKHIPAEDYDTWLSVAYALLSMTDEFNAEAMEGLFLAWSATSSKFDETQATNFFQRLKRGFVANREGGITKGTIIALAQAGGWKPNGNVSFEIIN